MKKFSTFLCVLAAMATATHAQVTIDKNSFPDADFRNWVLAQTYGEDGKLTDQEIAAVKEIDLINTASRSLTGIAYFTELTKLKCNGNKYLKSFDISKNTKLKSLNCSDNALTQLNVQHNELLQELLCSGNANLAELDVTANPNLTYLECSNTKISALNLQNNPKLTMLWCDGCKIKNYKMTELVESLPKVKDCALGVIDTKSASEQGNVITKSQVAATKAKGWTVYDWNGGSMTAYAGVDNPEGIEINSTNFPDKKFRDFVAEQKQDLDNNGWLSQDEIAKKTFVEIPNKGYTTLKGIEFFTELKWLTVSYNELTSLDVSKNTKLTTLNCYCNQLTSLNVSGCSALTSISCATNQLTSLDVSSCSALTYLDCSNNQLTALDVSNSPALTTLTISRNQIKGENMLKLVNSLPENNGMFEAISTQDPIEQNVITKSQVEIATGKGWKVYDYNMGMFSEYAGSEELTPIQRVTSAAADSNAWYTLDGKKLSAAPSAAGIYIHNGKKVVK